MEGLGDGDGVQLGGATLSASPFSPAAAASEWRPPPSDAASSPLTVEALTTRATGAAALLRPHLLCSPSLGLSRPFLWVGGGGASADADAVGATRGVGRLA